MGRGAPGEDTGREGVHHMVPAALAGGTALEEGTGPGEGTGRGGVHHMGLPGHMLAVEGSLGEGSPVGGNPVQGGIQGMQAGRTEARHRVGGKPGVGHSRGEGVRPHSMAALLGREQGMHLELGPLHQVCLEPTSGRDE